MKEVFVILVLLPGKTFLSRHNNHKCVYTRLPFWLRVWNMFSTAQSQTIFWVGLTFWHESIFRLANLFTDIKIKITLVFHSLPRYCPFAIYFNLRKIIKDHHFETSIRAKSNPSLSKRFQFCINLLLKGACKNLCKFTHICVGWFVNWIWCQFQLEEAYFAVNWEVVCKWISFFGNVVEFFSLKRWAADGFQIVDSVQKNFFQGEPTVERNANHIPIQEKRKVLVHI